MKTVYINKTKLRRRVLSFLLFTAMFVTGRYLGVAYEGATPTGLFFNAAENWGLGFGEPQTQPQGNESVEKMMENNAYYMGSNDKKIIYLTFDCGYENGNTPAILDALKKHNAPATFFVVGHYLQSAPELVKRMVAEGHFVGNHTFHHPDMSEIGDKASFEKELKMVSEEYHALTGSEMVKYYRPPQGKYSTENLAMAKELGFKTFFWSLAYADWDQNKQPEPQASIAKLTERVHPGAIVLLHNTSSTNAQILDELLTKWEEMGYTFGKLSDF